MRGKARAIVAVALSAMAAMAQANDSTAEMAAGGLVLRETDAIDMVTEDLRVSADLIEVRYVFRNRTDADVTTIVAFPMPDHDFTFDGDSAFPSGFETSVEGQRVAVQIERRATVAGRDVTAQLAELGVPLAHEDDRPIADALSALPEEAKARLIAAGIVVEHQYESGQGVERHIEPAWTLHETWYWEQRFPAGRELRVEHRYVPGAGGSVSNLLFEPDMRASDYGREMIARYCIDADFLAGINRMAREGRARSGNDYVLLPERTVSYILTTGGNWASPIGSFRLVVDKGDPANIVSFCGEGVRRISPTQFEMRRTDWRPDRDLNVLIIQPTPTAD